MAFTLLQTKLFIPTFHKFLSRPALINRLEEGREGSNRLILVSASAGSGKTSLLSEWSSLHPGLFCWYSLDIEDNEPNRFWKYVIASLKSIHPSLGKEAGDLIDSLQSGTTQSLLTALLNDVSAYAHPLILVLDDYHLISNLEIHSGMGFLLDHMPSNLSVVVATRADPPLPINRIRAHAGLTEIRETDLRFSVAEIAAYLRLMGFNLSDEDIHAIETRTEGWITALQLLALAMRARTQTQESNSAYVHTYVSAFTGSQRHILDYLTEEVFSNLEPHIQHFLICTSILEQMCPELCAEVISENTAPQPESGEIANCRTILNTLERSNIFTIALDENRHWFRYHHLFADLLANRLRETQSREQIQNLHHRASQWLARNDRTEQAIQQALLSTDYEFAASLIEPIAQAMMFSGQVNTLKGWVSSLPEDALQSHLRLQIFAVWIELLQGVCELNLQKVQDTQQLIQSLPDTPENKRLKAELMVVLCRFFAISGDTKLAIQMAQDALLKVGENDQASCARIQSALAIAQGLDGEIQKSEAAFYECLQLASTSGYYSLAAHTSMLVGMGNSHFGRLREPARILQRIIDQGTFPGEKMAYPAGQGLIGLASIYLEWNRLEEAGMMLDQGIALCNQAGLDGAFAGRVQRARLLQAQGDLAAALREIQSVESVFGRKDHDTLGRQVQILLAMGQVETAERFLPALDAILDRHPSEARIPFLFLEAIKIQRCRILLAQGDLELALAHLDAIQAQAGPAQRNGHVIEALTLKAIILQKQQGRSIQALPSLEQALALARTEGYILTFLEFGAEILPLLQAIRVNATSSEGLKQYAGELLSAFSKQGFDIPISIPEPVDAIDLSQREIEILRLIDAGFSNQEIADQLFITLHTVKKHSSHIFSKLGVTSRTQAVAKARQAGLLH